ncbi:MAG: amino acid permease [Jatrophihabitans sp.]|uniref:amino acid permease n=1 Tax=Jatrophihabitans sp. TaxID=1932789 RepID=UPI003F7F457F
MSQPVPAALPITDLPERLGYRIKSKVLGPPLVSARLHDEKLSKKAALGVLSSDCISSSAYGSEEMLIFLLPAFGLSGFHLLMPMTVVVLAVLLIMTIMYRQVVMVYTQAGGSYVVARENFGPRIAQIAAVALLIDYIVTVAVQTAAGVAAVVSLAPSLSPYTRELTVAIILVLAYGNLRGVREAGRAFALPTYLFVGTAGLAIAVGVVRDIAGNLPHVAHHAGMIAVHDDKHAILAGASIFVLLKAFANGGASLTGLEAISNGVSAFKSPAGANARRTLTVMSLLLGSLVLGVSYLAYRTHATPYESGTPTVISQVAHAAFGHAWYGHLAYGAVQIATALILITGANTPFTGFPFLASFIAEDSFLPRQMTRRGHRLAFSNGILVLTALALTLVITVGAQVDKLIPFYAIGVFTGFSMAGYGMAHHYFVGAGRRRVSQGVVCLTGGVVSTLVVLIFAVVKFTEGAWLVVVLGPLLWWLLLRLNSRYRAEAAALDLVSRKFEQGGAPQHYARHTVLVYVDRLDLAVLRALRYAGSLRPTDIRAVHIAIDAEAAQHLQDEWVQRGIAERTPLTLVECPDRRLIHTAAATALDVAVRDRSEVTILLPRRSFSLLSQRLLHDRTADRIAAAVTKVPHVNATIVPFDTTLPDETVQRLTTAAASADRADGPVPVVAPAAPEVATDGTTPIAAADYRQKVTIEGRVRALGIDCTAGTSLAVELFDASGGIRLLFFGRSTIPGLTPGARVRASGRVGEYQGRLAIANPAYELRPDDDGRPGTAKDEERQRTAV